MPEYAQEEFRLQNDFGIELALSSVDVRRVDRDPRNTRDTPPPIVYDDEFGKTMLTFSKVGSVDGYKAYDIKYRQNDQKPYSLSRFLGQDFFFWWTNHASFFTLASDGTPMVSINYNALASSRKHLLSLGHEIGHTHQYEVDRDLWKVLGTQSNRNLVRDLKKQYPTLASHIDDLSVIRQMSQTRERDKLFKLFQRLQHISPTEFRLTGIDVNLPAVADEMLKLDRESVPVGLTHYGDFLIPRHLQHTLPGVYVILDSMGEHGMGVRYEP
jgi:hypothetical protein